MQNFSVTYFFSFYGAIFVTNVRNFMLPKYTQKYCRKMNFSVWQHFAHFFRSFLPSYQNEIFLCKFLRFTKYHQKNCETNDAYYCAAVSLTPLKWIQSIHSDPSHTNTNKEFTWSQQRSKRHLWHPSDQLCDLLTKRRVVSP